MPNVIAYKNYYTWPFLFLYFNFYEFPFLTLISDHEKFKKIHYPLIFRIFYRCNLSSKGNELPDPRILLTQKIR